MGNQFWWFYDALAVAAVLICMFISGRKGIMKSVTSLVAYLISAAIAFGLSISLGGMIANSAMQESNAKKIDKSLSNYKFDIQVANYLSSLDYGITADPEKITKIYSGNKDYNTELYKYVKLRSSNSIKDDQEAFNKKLAEGYAQLIKNIVSEEMSKYAAEVTAKEIREHPTKFEELIPLLRDKETKTPAAEFISENYVQPAYDTEIKLIVFLIAFVLLMLITIFFSRNLTGDSSGNAHPRSCGRCSYRYPQGCCYRFRTCSACKTFSNYGQRRDALLQS
jgi:hypothetical protein